MLKAGVVPLRSRAFTGPIKARLNLRGFSRAFFILRSLSYVST